MMIFAVILLILSFPWLAYSQIEAIDTTLLTGPEYDVKIEAYPYFAVEEKPYNPPTPLKEKAHSNVICINPK